MTTDNEVDAATQRVVDAIEARLRELGARGMKRKDIADRAGIATGTLWAHSAHGRHTMRDDTARDLSRALLWTEDSIANLRADGTPPVEVEPAEPDLTDSEKLDQLHGFMAELLEVNGELLSLLATEQRLDRRLASLRDYKGSHGL